VPGPSPLLSKPSSELSKPLPTLRKTSSELRKTSQLSKPLPIKSIPSSLSDKSSKFSNLSKSVPPGPKKPIIDLSKYSLVIQLSGSESEFEEEEVVSVSPNKQLSSMTPLGNVNISKLSKSQQ